MTRTLLLCVVLAGCGAATPDPETIRLTAVCSAVEESYGQTADKLIDSGICDEHKERPQDCAPFLAIEDLYIATKKELGCLSPAQ